LTWQKIIPIILLTKITITLKLNWYISTSIFTIRIILTTLSNLKILIITSSLIHTGWLIVSIISFKIISILYLLMYSLILMLVNIIIINNNSTNLTNQIKTKKRSSVITIIIFNLAGIPPLLGFFIKLAVFYSLFKINAQTILILLLTITASFRFFLYIQLITSNLLFIRQILFKKITPQKGFNQVVFFISVIIPIVLLY